MKIIKGRAIKNSYTKILVSGQCKNRIAVIKHRYIDLVAAQDLKYKRVKGVINCEESAGRYGGYKGADYLTKNNIGLFDACDPDIFNKINNNDKITIKDSSIYANGVFLSHCTHVMKSNSRPAADPGENGSIRSGFIQNTIEHMKDEMDYFINQPSIPDIDTNMMGKDVLIVSRGRNYRNDLSSIKRYIAYRKPVVIGVDGGGDALTDLGIKCDIIIGDMDSVSDRSLLKCGEVLVHSYSSGYAPGAERVSQLGIPYKPVSLLGTSEDAALFLASLLGASKIYMIGSHTCMDEFIEKGRPGMGSTAILRILAGSNLVDLKGVSSIIEYNNRTYLKTGFLILMLLILCFFVLSYGNAYSHIVSYLKQLLELI